ncbi:PH domain-containing protein [Priestia sp. YIM B13490]|uniref:PH domain-containing protein n=1 Tax=Priestia sp. YIM B13490 TaxID=3366310 RepID=UPI00366D2351
MNNISFRRNSIFLLPYSLFVLTRQYIIFFAMLFSIGSQYRENIIFKIIFIFSICMIIVNIFRIFIDWITFKYLVDGKAIYIESGLFFKKKIKLSFDKIQNVMEKTPFTFKVLKMTSLKIDSGVDTDDGKIELKMIKKSECNDILEKVTLLSKKEEYNIHDKCEENDMIYQINNKEIFIMSITSLKLILFIPFLMSIYHQISEYFTTTLIDKYIDSLKDLANLTTLSIILLILIFLLSLIYGYVVTYIKFGKFSVSRGYDSLYIKSGFINLKFNSIPIDKIISLNFTTNIFFNWLKYHKVKAITLGETFNTEANNALLFPFIKKEKTKSLLENITPDLLDTILLKKLSWKSGFLNLISYCPFIIILTALLILQNSLSLLFISIIIILLYQYFKQTKKKYGFNYNKKIIKLQFGFFVKKTYITSFDNIEQIVIKQGILQKCFGTCSLIIFIKTNQTKCFRIQNILYSDCEKIYNLFTNKD